MKRRVNIICNNSESAMVEGGYEFYIEEHLRVSNRNLIESRLRGIHNLKDEQYRGNLRTDIKAEHYYANKGGTAEV